MKTFIQKELATACLLATAVFAQNKDLPNQSSTSLNKPTGTPSATLVNINNIAMWIRADGWSARDPLSGNSGTFFPRGTAAAIFQDGILWGGYVVDGSDPVLRVGGQAYTIGTVAGRIISAGVAEDPMLPEVRIWRIRRDYQTADLRQDAAELLRKKPEEVTEQEIAEVRNQYAIDWRDWPWQKGAPFYDRNTNGVMDSDEEPGLLAADQVVWLVANDLNSGATLSLYGSPPIGLEIQMTLWGYAEPAILRNVIFKRVRLIYKGTATTPANATIDSMFIGQWSDPDLGDFANDFVGCDTLLSLGYVYNANRNDSHYDFFHLPPPAAGYDLLHGPLVTSQNFQDKALFDFKPRHGYRNLPLTSFIYLVAGPSIEPPWGYSFTLFWYNLLNGYHGQPYFPAPPVPYRDHLGNPTKFPLSGDSVTRSGDVDGIVISAGDRRIMLSSGPFTMALGDTQEVVIALVAGLGSSNLSSISVLRFNDAFVQEAYSGLFDIGSLTPAQPPLVASGADRQVILDWGSDRSAIANIENAASGNYRFEGYTVYQLPSATNTRAQAVRIKTFDVINDFSTLLESYFDSTSGLILQRPFQFGENSGIQRHVQIDHDYLRNRPLVNGQTYYYAVTSYNVNTNRASLVPSFESELVVLPVVPEAPKPGVRFSAVSGDTLPVRHTRGVSDARVQVRVIDPARSVPDDYLIQIDSSDYALQWNLLNLSTHGTLFARQTVFPQEDDAARFAGLQSLIFPPPARARAYAYELGPGATDIRMAGTRAFGDIFDGGIGFLGIHPDSPGLFGLTSSLWPSQMRDVEIRFSDTRTQMAYRYMRRAALPTHNWDCERFIINAEGGYAYQDTRAVPFTVWEVDTTDGDPAPRQLTVGFLENCESFPKGSVNGRWDPTDGDLGGREIVWIFPDAHDSTMQQEKYKVNLLLNSFVDIMYFLWVRQTQPPEPVYHEGDVLTIYANHPLTPQDEYSFSGKTFSYDAGLAKVDVNLINVFPNPYYGLNRAEVSRYAHFVTFSHLPPQARVRIFDLAGTLVRRLEKNDDSQFLRWDLLNEQGWLVASGIYLVYIEMPALGKTKVLKLVVITEQQIPPFY